MIVTVGNTKGGVGKTPLALNLAIARALADFPQLEYLATPVRRRKGIANAAGQGLSVLESPRDPKACDEVTALVGAVFGRS